MKTLILSVILLTSCAAPATQTQKNVAQNPTQLKLVIPHASWEPIFFEGIDKRASIAKLRSLRTTALPNDDLEVRVWHGFGETALEGFVLKRGAGNWSAVHLDGIHPRLPRSEYEKSLPAPKSGWEECWRKLMDAGISKLPDASEINCSGGTVDGMSYVVEISTNETYKTYLYDNPSYAPCHEAKQMIEIGNIISDQFNLPEMGTKE